MAKILNKDPVTYQRERDSFIRELRQFHESRGTPFRKIPKINGHEIDLYLLYVLVTAHGGWIKVNSRSEWETLLEQFSLPKQCVNSGVALKQIYLRYLDRYEKRHYLGEDVDRDGTDDEESRHRRWSARALHSVPLSYNHSQHNVSENLRNYNGLSTDLYKASDYERLSLSLLSPLPNEQDFAINVCTLLSNEGKHILHLDKCPRIVNFLLAHAGVFSHTSLRPLFEEVYGSIRNNPLRQFWSDTLAEPELRDFTDETKFPRRGKSKTCEDDDNPHTVTEKICVGGVDLEIVVKRSAIISASQALAEAGSSQADDDVETDCDQPMEGPHRLEIAESDRDLFCLGRSYGTRDWFGQRVLQVATILRNLSFDEDNAAVLGQSCAFLRFAALCAGSRWSGLHVLGLDMLGNVAAEVPLSEPGSDKLSAGLLAVAARGLASTDRAIVLASLELLNKLSQREDNEDIMLRALDQKVYDQICSFLTLQDIMLLIYTLECLYSLSSLGERACNCIVRVHGAVDTLVSLITVEAQSYGPKACILMRLVETVSTTHSATTPSTTGAGTQPASTTAVQSTASPSVSVTSTSHSNTPLQQQQQQHSLGPSLTSTPHRPPPTPTQHRILMTSQANLPPPPPHPTVTLAPSVISQQQHHHQHHHQQPHHHPLQQQQQHLQHQHHLQHQPQHQHQPLQQHQHQQQPLQQQPLLQQQQQTPSNAPHQQHTTQQAVQENEQFALAWLRATFETAPVTCRIEQAELYKQYLTACARVGRRGVIAPLHFPRCVRSVFGGSVGPNLQRAPGTSTVLADAQYNALAFYEGIKVRANTCSPTTTPITSSPRTETPPLVAVAVGSPTPCQTPPPTVSSPSPAPTRPVPAPSPSISPAASVRSPESLALDAPSPSSPILKAQLSAPPKPREASKGDAKSQQTQQHQQQPQQQQQQQQPVQQQQSQQQASNTPSTSSSSLIKSLLATKVTPPGVDCMMPAPATVCAASSDSQLRLTAQVTQRQQQQRLLQQQLQADTPSGNHSVGSPAVRKVLLGPISAGTQLQSTSNSNKVSVMTSDRHRAARINGVRTPVQQVPLQGQNDVPKDGNGTVSVEIDGGQVTTCLSSDGQGGGNAALRGRREPPQPPPPPLSATTEDSNSTGNSSLASSAGSVSCTGSISSLGAGGTQIIVEDGENSLSSFEGILLNGMDIDVASDDTNSKDSSRSATAVVTAKITPQQQNSKSMMLADLLEKKPERKDPPVLNGVLGKSFELVENHLEKVLKDTTTSTVQQPLPGGRENTGSASQHPNGSSDGLPFKTVGTVTDRTEVAHSQEGNTQQMQQQQHALKRPADEAGLSSVEVESKRPHLEVNGNASPSPAPSPSPASADTGVPSSSAANLYAALAASALEGELDQPELEVVPVPQQAAAPSPQQQQTAGSIQLGLRQVFETATVHGPGGQSQQVIVAPRHVIVSQAGNLLAAQQQVLIATGSGNVTIAGGKPQAAGTPGTRTQVVLQQAGGSQLILSPGSVGGVGGQYLQAGQAYVVPQTALVQGQGQTVLVAQTAQQQGTGTKTIIILQPQASSPASGNSQGQMSLQQHQKVMVTPQGQPVVVTQVPRPAPQPPPALVPSSSGTSLSPPPVRPAPQPVHRPAPALTPSSTAGAIPVTSVVRARTSPPVSVPRPPFQQTVSTAVRPSLAPNSQVAAKVVESRTPQVQSVQPSATGTSSGGGSNVIEMVRPHTPSPSPSPSLPPLAQTSTVMTQARPAVSVNSTVTTPSNPPQKPLGVPAIDGSQFLCEWRGCMRSFKSANQVYMHACEAHCPKGSEEIQCLWERCDAMKRKRFSLMTHLYDRHCNAEVLRMMAVRRRQLSQSGRSEIPPPQPPPPHPGYAPNAAFHAIKRHALEFVNPKEMMRPVRSGPTAVPLPTRPGPSPAEQDDNEGPVTKSIRLTASLILRNLVIYSTNGRRFLRSYEPHLAGIALSNVESSRTIAQVLYDMNQQAGQR